MDNPITDLVDIPVVPYLDVHHAASAYGRVWYDKYQWPVLVVGIAILIIIVLSYFAFDFSERFGWTVLIGVGGFVFSIYGVIYSGGKLYFFKSIAQEWKWEYKPEVAAQTLHTTLLRVGHTHRFTDVLAGTWEHHSALIGSFSYTVGSGKNSNTYGGALAKVDTQAQLAHILFAVKRDIYDDHIVRASGLVPVPIEQLIGERRGLYTERKLEIEALQLFTAKSIEEIELRWPDYSFEIIGSEVYAYGSSSLSSRAQIQDLFALTQYIIQHIVPALRRLEGSVKAMHQALNPKIKV